MPEKEWPTVGRIVHVTILGHCLAAIVTHVGDRRTNEGIDLCVFAPSSVYSMQSVMGDGNPSRESGPMSGTWHWPERSGA